MRRNVLARRMAVKIPDADYEIPTMAVPVCTLPAHRAGTSNPRRSSLIAVGRRRHGHRREALIARILGYIIRPRYDLAFRREG